MEAGGKSESSRHSSKESPRSPVDARGACAYRRYSCTRPMPRGGGDEKSKHNEKAEQKHNVILRALSSFESLSRVLHMRAPSGGLQKISQRPRPRPVEYLPLSSLTFVCSICTHAHLTTFIHMDAHTTLHPYACCSSIIPPLIKSRLLGRHFIFLKLKSCRLLLLLVLLRHVLAVRLVRALRWWWWRVEGVSSSASTPRDCRVASKQASKVGGLYAP